MPRAFWMLPPLRRLAAVVFLFGCGACTSFDVSWGPADQWTSPAADEMALRSRFPDAGAIHLSDEGRIEIFGTGGIGFSVFTHRRVTRILNNRGHRHAYVVIPYAENSTVTNIAARTIHPDGSVTRLDPENIFDVSLYPSFIFFSDQKAKIFTLPGVEDGAVVEYAYTLTIHSQTLWHGWNFQSDIPVVRSRFVMLRPSEWEVRSRLYGAEITPRVLSVPQGFKSTTEWERSDIPPLEPEYAAPTARERVTFLAMAPLGFRTWDDVSQWYHSLSKSRMNADATTRELARRIVQGAGTDAERLRRIHGWVRDNVRYVAVEIGIGGFQPHDANAVRANLYGDCKDMVTLLCTLGREVGLEVNPALISTWQNGPADTSFASPLQFNHVVAHCPTVGDGGTWMDATEKGCPFGQIPWYDQGLPVLTVGARGEAEIRVSPRQPAHDNRVMLMWDVHLGRDGSADVYGSTVLTGSAATDLRDQLHYVGSRERRRWLESYLSARCSGVRLDSMWIEGIVPTAESLSVGYRFSALLAAPSGPSLCLRPGLFNASDLPDHFRSPRRVAPIRLRFGMTQETDLRFHADSSLSVPAVNDSLSSPFGRFTRGWSMSQGVLRYRSSFTITGSDIPADQYGQFREFLDGMRRLELVEAVIARKGS